MATTGLPGCRGHLRGREASKGAEGRKPDRMVGRSERLGARRGRARRARHYELGGSVREWRDQGVLGVVDGVRRRGRRLLGIVLGDGGVRELT